MDDDDNYSKESGRNIRKIKRVKSKHEVPHRVHEHEKLVEKKRKRNENYTDSDRNDYKKEIIFIGGLIIIVFMAYNGGYFNMLDFSLNPSGGTIGIGSPMPSTPAVTPAQQYRGSLGVEVYHRDALDNSEARSEGIDLNTTYYRQTSNGEFQPLGFGDDTEIIIDTSEPIFISVEPTENSNYFIAPNEMFDANPRIYDFDFKDIDKDSFQEWAFKIDLNDLPTDVGGIPRIIFFSSSFDNGIATLTSPSDIDHYGSSWIRWQLIIPEETVLVVSAFRIDVESNDDTLLNREHSFIQIPFIGQVQFDEMDVVHFEKKTSYLYDLADDISGSDYIVTPINGDPMHEIPVHLVTSKTFGGLDEKLNVTLILTVVSPEQKFSDLKDTVTLIPAKVDLEDITLNESIRCTDIEDGRWVNCETITKVDYNIIHNSTNTMD